MIYNLLNYIFNIYMKLFNKNILYYNNKLINTLNFKQIFLIKFDLLIFFIFILYFININDYI